MLVPLPATSDPPLPKSIPTTTQWSKMAPSSPNYPIDWRVQTIENCRFISRPGSFVLIVTTKEALGGFKAVVVRIQDGQRAPLFSESAATEGEALRALHARSAEAVQNHVDANGWDFVVLPQQYWARREAENDQDPGESDAESSYSESASSTVTLSDPSDDDMVSVGGQPSRNGKESKTNKKNKKSKKSWKTKERMGRSRSPSPSQSRSRSRSRSQSTARSRSRSGSPKRSRSASVSSVASSSGGEESRASSRPPHMDFRPNHMRLPPNYPPGWEPSHFQIPPGPISFPQGLRVPPFPHPPPPLPPPQFPNVQPPIPGNGTNAAPRIPGMFQVGGPGQPPRLAGSTQSNKGEGNKANTPTPNTGYNPFTTVFWSPAPAPAPPQAPAPAPAPVVAGSPQRMITPPYDILLDIKWPDLPDNTNQTQQHRVLEQVPRLSAALIKERALAYVRRQLNPSANGETSTDNANTKSPNLSASLRKVGVKGAICHLSEHHSDDLYSLVHDMSSEQSRLAQNRPIGFATFDIEVYVPQETNISASSPPKLWEGPPAQNPMRFIPPPPPIPGWGGPSTNINNNNTKKPTITTTTSATSMNTHASRRPASQRPVPQQPRNQPNTNAGVTTTFNNAAAPGTTPFISPLPPHLQQQYQWNQTQSIQQQMVQQRAAALRSLSQDNINTSNGAPGAGAGGGGMPGTWIMPTPPTMNMNLPLGMGMGMGRQHGPPASMGPAASAAPPPPPPPPGTQVSLPLTASTGGSASSSKKKIVCQNRRHHHSSSNKSGSGSGSGSEKVNINTPPSVAPSVVSTASSVASEASSSATTMRFMDEEEVYYESDA